MIYLVIGELVGWDYTKTWVVHGYSKREVAKQCAKDAEDFYESYQVEKDECFGIKEKTEINSITSRALKDRINKLKSLNNPFDSNKDMMNIWIDSPDSISYKVVEAEID